MSYAPTLLLILWATSLAYFDVRYRRIPNLLSLGAWFVGVLLLVLNQSSLLGHQVSSALMAGCFAGAVTLPAYAFKLLGGGDVKMLIAIGLLTSLQITVSSFVVAGLLGAMIAMTWLFIEHWGGFFMRENTREADPFNAWLSTPARKRTMPYGALFSIGLGVSLWLDIAS